MAEIESYAPMMAYLVRSMQSGSDLAKTFWRSMIDNAEQYLEEGVRAGTLKPSRDPKARAKFLGINSGGGFLLYLQMHDNPTDLRAVLRDYARGHDAARARDLLPRPDGRLDDVRRVPRPTRTRHPVHISTKEITMTATSLQRANTSDRSQPAVEIQGLVKIFRPHQGARRPGPDRRAG